MKIIQALIVIKAVSAFHSSPISSTRPPTGSRNNGHFPSSTVSFSNLNLSQKKNLILTTNSNANANYNNSKESLPSSNVSLSLSSTTSNENESDEANKMAKKVKGRKKRVIGGYKIITYSYLLSACSIGVISKIPYYTTGPLLTAGLAYILTDAATNDRLTSDTYKRLNLVLGTNALLSSIGSILFKGLAVLPLMGFIAVVNSIKGYGYGLKGWELKTGCAKVDLTNGIKSSISSMIQIPTNLKSAGYLASTLTMTYLTALKFIEVLESVLNANSKRFAIGTRLFRLGKLMTITAICFTLKDAADRDRLGGTTFIELNYLLSFTFATMAANVKNLPASNIPLCGAAAFFSLFSLFHGLSSAAAKKKSSK